MSSLAALALSAAIAAWCGTQSVPHFAEDEPVRRVAKFLLEDVVVPRLAPYMERQGAIPSPIPDFLREGICDRRIFQFDARSKVGRGWLPSIAGETKIRIVSNVKSVCVMQPQSRSFPGVFALKMMGKIKGKPDFSRLFIPNFVIAILIPIPICQKVGEAIPIPIPTRPDPIFVRILSPSRYLAHGWPLDQS